MAQSISDVFARAERVGSSSRRARFLGPRFEAEESHQEEGNVAEVETSMLRVEPSTRMAAFRPAEDLAQRRDVVDAFFAALDRDGSKGLQENGAHLIAMALAAEAVGDHERAFQHLREFEQVGGQFRWENVALWQRVLRKLESYELLSKSLKETTEYDDAPRWVRLYAGLERAAMGWSLGDDPERVQRRIRRALRSVDSPTDLDLFAALWAMQIVSDSALEAGHPDVAMTELDSMLAQPGISSDVRLALEARKAVWLHVFGKHHEARNVLDGLAARGSLPGDLDDLLLHLYFEAGEREKAFQLLRSQAREASRLQIHTVPLVMLYEKEGENGLNSRNILRAATEEQDDWTLLRLREQLLERRGDCGGELIDVLNRRLEGPLANGERVQVLTRLGRLYEEEAVLEEAAAEVYREALSYDPRHVPALRALGRLYTRGENWHGLAELYEREISSEVPPTRPWRRHFQLAELYEHHLGRDEKALENYLVVLEAQPNYLPALKSSARILGRLGRWSRLADLFLRMVDTAPSRRQKLYLLDKVAEVAEQRLENFDVAIGAWEEILELAPDHPRAYSALGRLFSRTGRWRDLISLNEAETELIDDSEEIAAALLRNAQIAERNLDDLALAERFYRRALNVIPDYLPALEALGRIYLRGSRWNEIVNMTGRELRSLQNPESAMRQLGALAEIFETRLDRRSDAIAIYEELYEINPEDLHIYATLCRLYRCEEAFERLETLLLDRIERMGNTTEVAPLYGELARIAEWELDDTALAMDRYLLALRAEPTNLHWLSGVSRTWQASHLSASEVAEELEDLLMHAREEQVRDRYFLIIARLRERAECGPVASRAYRAHGDSSSLENQIVLRLAMAVAGEREGLAQTRRALAHFPMQKCVVADRLKVDPGLLEAFARDSQWLPESAKRWLSAQVHPEAGRVLDDGSSLRWDLFELLRGVDLHQQEGEGDAETPTQMRLRALQARQQGNHQRYLSWSLREVREGSDALKAARYLELARYTHREKYGDVDDFFEKACVAVFPELLNNEDPGNSQIEISFEYPLISNAQKEELFEALAETNRWEALRQCLEARVARPGLERVDRLELFERLATIYEKKLRKYEGARDALVHCWQIAEEPRYLRSIVVLATEYKERADALRYQRCHYEALSHRLESDAQARLQSGIWLADLLLGGDDDQEFNEGIICLENLVRIFQDAKDLTLVYRMLGRAYGQVHRYEEAVAVFEQVLHFQVRGEELSDWRLLIRFLRGPLESPDRAYLHQWNLVRAFPDSQRDLDTLIDLAGEAGELADCVEHLSQLASATTSEGKVSLIARAAEAADEELGHAEEAFRLFDRVLELTDSEHPRRRYYERRRAMCLARMAGREARALEAFRDLLEDEPFESANFRGMETLFDRCGAHDRLRIARQSLRMLGCETNEEVSKTKIYPTRSVTDGSFERALLPESLRGGVLEVLRAAMPMAEKVWSEQLPQRKAFDGRRIRDTGEAGFYRDLQAALLAFGVTRFKLYVGESGPEVPMVFGDATPVVWIHEQLLERLNSAESRFVAGYCAAMIYSEIPNLGSLDGRQLWHLIEGALYRQTGQGFTRRLDLQSQTMAEEIGGPFDGPARKRVQKACEGLEDILAECHCEAWSRELDVFAARAGLVLAGDLAAAARGLLLLGGWSLPLEEDASQRRIRNEDAIADLVRLANGEEYLELRYRLGLAGRPSRLKI